MNSRLRLTCKQIPDAKEQAGTYAGHDQTRRRIDRHDAVCSTGHPVRLSSDCHLHINTCMETQRLAGQCESADAGGGGGLTVGHEEQGEEDDEQVPEELGGRRLEANHPVADGAEEQILQVRAGLQLCISQADGGALPSGLQQLA